MLTKAIESQQTHIVTTDEDLALVRKYALREIAQDQVWLGRMRLANTKVDRSGERFTKAYLHRFADTGPGRSLMPGHNYDALPMGRFYKFGVVGDGDHYGLDAWYYLNAKDEKLISDIELGVLKDVSIGFNAGPRICDLCEKEWRPWGGGKDFCEHHPTGDYDGRTCTVTYVEAGAPKAEMMEGSLVWAGCQFDAQAVPKEASRFYSFGPDSSQFSGGLSLDLLSLGPGGFPRAGDTRMEIKEALVEIDRLKALTAATEREKALQAELDELKPKAALIADGEKYHAFITADILRMADALDVANHDEEKRKRKQYEAILSAVKAAGAPALEAQREAIAVEFNARLSNGKGEAGDGAGNGAHDKNKSELLDRFAGGLL